MKNAATVRCTEQAACVIDQPLACPWRAVSEHEESSAYTRQTAYVIDQPLACPLIVVSEHEGSSDYSRQTAYVMDQPLAIAPGSCLSINSGLDKKKIDGFQAGKTFHYQVACFAPLGRLLNSKHEEGSYYK